MAESVDALVSNTSGAIRAGSTPALGTRGLYKFLIYRDSLFFYTSICAQIVPNQHQLTALSLRRHITRHAEKYQKWRSIEAVIIDTEGRYCT